MSQRGPRRVDNDALISLVSLRMRSSWLIAVAALLPWLLQVSPAAAASQGPSFCASPSARDFGFSSLPAVHEPPKSGATLGHPAVGIYGGWESVMDKPEEFGYGFSEDDYAGPVKVEWLVTATLRALGRGREPTDEVAHSRHFFRDIDAAHQPHIGLTPPDRRGFYRFDLRIQSGGRTLGSYSSYFKLVRPSWRPRLRLDRRSVHAGQTIRGRVENLGTERVSLGEEQFVQRRAAAGWVGAGWSEGANGLVEIQLGPGAPGGCFALSVPQDTPPGRYRVVKPVEGHAGSVGRRKVILEAGFEVAAFDLAVLRGRRLGSAGIGNAGQPSSAVPTSVASEIAATLKAVIQFRL
jgi:hypothetical protein